MTVENERRAGAESSELSRRERKKRAKRRRIRDAAAELFHEKGFEAATTREIAERADVATGTLFLYAADKRDLLNLVYGDRLGHAVETAFEELPAEASLVDQLVFVFGRFFDLYADDPKLALHFVKEQLHGEGMHNALSERVREEFFVRLAALVRGAQERGEVAEDVDPARVAWTSFALYYSALTGWLGGWATAEEALEGRLRSALELQRRGLAPR